MVVGYSDVVLLIDWSGELVVVISLVGVIGFFIKVN